MTAFNTDSISKLFTSSQFTEKDKTNTCISPCNAANNSFEPEVCEFPRRTHLTNASNRPASRRPINTIHSRLVANVVVKYQHLPQFQVFMERYHCFPYVTEYKFPINMWINERLEQKKRGSENIKSAESPKPSEIVQAPQPIDTELDFSEEDLPNFDDEDSSSSNSDSDEGEQQDEVSHDIFIIEEEENQSELPALAGSANEEYIYAQDEPAKEEYIYSQDQLAAEYLEKASRPTSLNKIKGLISRIKYEKPVYVIQD